MGDVARRRASSHGSGGVQPDHARLFASWGTALRLVPRVAGLFGADAADHDLHLKPFGVIIFLTLGLAVFDLGKTILERRC